MHTDKKEEHDEAVFSRRTKKKAGEEECEGKVKYQKSDETMKESAAAQLMVEFCT